MIRALVHFIAFPALTFWHGSLIILAALFRVPLVRGGDGVFDRLCRGWGRRLMRVNRLETVVEGAERLRPGRPCVYVANHVSLVDIWAMLAELPGTVRFVFKKELMRVPFLGWAALRAGHILIDRQSRNQAFAAYDAAAREIQAGTSAVVYPEGTRSADGRMLPFKKGPFVLAIAAQVPVVPVWVGGTYEIMKRGAAWPRAGTCILRIGEEIPTAGMTYEDRDQLSDAAAAAIRQLGARS